MKFRVIIEVDENPKPDKEMLESNPEYGEYFMRRRAAEAEYQAVLWRDILT